MSATVVGTTQALVTPLLPLRPAMHLNHKRSSRPHQWRQVLKEGTGRRFSQLDETSRDQCALRRYGTLNEQIEVAERTVG